MGCCSILNRTDLCLVNDLIAGFVGETEAGDWNNLREDLVTGGTGWVATFHYLIVNITREN